MTRVEGCALEYIRLVLEAARLKTSKSLIECENAEYPMVPEDGRGTPPCWACMDIPVSEYCESCKRRQCLHEQRQRVVKQRQSALAKLKRAVIAASRIGEIP
jgi:hypothetical protein